MAEPKKPFHETVAERLIEQLKQGTAPWQRPWKPGEPSAFIPMNPTTGKRYRGINAVFLMAQGRSDQRWLTYKQAAAIDAQVKKGERGTPIQYWKFSEEQQRIDEQGKPVFDAQGDPVMHSVQLERPRVFFATVFNAEQIDGMPALKRKEIDEPWNALERAEAILAASGAVIRHGEQDRAYYRPATDSIHLPDRTQFPTADNYYAIALHELGHWTGHESRLNRDLANPFGSIAYAKEELRAEIASMILGDELGIGHDPGQHAAYVKSWIQVLQDDPMEIVRAAADAEKIQDFVLGLEQKQVQQQAEGIGVAPAYFDSDNQLHDSVTGELLPPDWQGIAQGGASLWFIGQEAGERSFTVLRSTDLQRAIDEAWTVKTLSLDVSAVIANNPEVSFSHFTAFQGETLDAALRIRGLTTIANVTGAAPAEFQETALTRLSFVFGVEPEHMETDNAYLERKGLTQAFVDAAERCIKAERALETSRAREHEELVRNDATASDDDRERVKEARKAAEHRELLSDPVYMARIAQLERDAAHIDADAPLPHLVDYATFAATASAVALDEEHPRGWQIYAGGNNLGFSDAESAELALVEVHRRQVNNALYSRSADAPESMPRSAMPPAHVIEEYPELKDKFAEVIKAAMSNQPTYIAVPFKEKNDAKALGAKWDRQEQSWYVPSGVDVGPFAKWAKAAEAIASEQSPKQTREGAEDALKPTTRRQYLAVPYGERDLAKQAGALWDRAVKSWYAGPKADQETVARWAPEKVAAEQAPAMDPRAEFADAMRSVGLIAGKDGRGDEHPIMDGKKHRVAVEGGKKGAVDGFYIGHLDGHPAGRIINNLTGMDITWKSKGYSLDPEKKALMQAEAGAKLEARAAEQARLFEEKAQSLQSRLTTLKPVESPTPYMTAKGIQVHPGAFTDGEGKTTYIPAIDADNKVWTMQYIQEDGTKRFAKDSRKEGCFHVVGGIDGLSRAPVIVITEGYATAATLSEALGHATVSAFDSGNLPAVATALKAKFPDKPFVIAGDDDQHLEATLGRNPGRLKMDAAAKAIGAGKLLPIFAPGERESSPKGFTDFNDLATKSVFGLEGVQRQISAVVATVLARGVESLNQEERLGQAKGQKPGLGDTGYDELPKRRRTAKM